MNTCRQSNLWVWAICLLLAAGTQAVYWQSCANDFINFDDPYYVTENIHVQQGLTPETVKWAFSSGYQGNWHPLTWLSHALDYQLYGLQPAGHHRTNVILHTVNVLLLFLVLRRMTGTLWRSALVASLFAWHPLHVESVAWIAERKDVLSTLFGFTALWTYERYVHNLTINSDNSRVANRKAKIFYGLTLLLFALSLMAKPMLVTLPFLFLLLDYWPLRRVFEGKAVSGFGTRALLLEKLPFLAVAGVCSVLTFATQSAFGAVAKLPLSYRLCTAVISYVRYVGKTLWPTDLAVLYPRPAYWPGVWVVGAIIILICVSVLAVRALPKAPFTFTGWFWFLGTLVPVIGIIQVGLHSIADRYTYVPSIGLFIIFAWGLERLSHHRPFAKPAIIAAVCVVAACLAVTWRQVRFWKNSETIFQHTLAVTSQNPVAHGNLAAALLKQGRLSEAYEHFCAATRMDATYLDAIVGQAAVLDREGHPNEAIALLDTLTNRVASFVVEFNLGNLLSEKGEPSRSERHYRNALALKPDFTDARYNLALNLMAQSRFDEATAELNSVRQVKPNFPGVWINLGTIAVQRDRLDEAINCFQSALKLSPDDNIVRFNLAKVFSAKGRFEEARDNYLEGLRGDPGNAEAHRDFGYALVQAGHLDAAVSEFQAAIRLQPTAQSYYDLAVAESMKRDQRAAITANRQALALDPDLPSALNNLAWMLATDPDSTLRDGKEAVSLAERACERTGYREPILIGTLAAAYAEAGRFDDAIKAAKKAQALALAGGLSDLARHNAELLGLYEAGKPFHESPAEAQH